MPLQWKHGVLTTGLPGKTLGLCISFENAHQVRPLWEAMASHWATVPWGGVDGEAGGEGEHAFH